MIGPRVGLLKGFNHCGQKASSFWRRDVYLTNQRRGRWCNAPQTPVYFQTQSWEENFCRLSWDCVLSPAAGRLIFLANGQVLRRGLQDAAGVAQPGGAMMKGWGSRWQTSSWDSSQSDSMVGAGRGQWWWKEMTRRRGNSKCWRGVCPTMTVRRWRSQVHRCPHKGTKRQTSIWTSCGRSEVWSLVPDQFSLYKAAICSEIIVLVVKWGYAHRMHDNTVFARGRSFHFVCV